MRLKSSFWSETYAMTNGETLTRDWREFDSLSGIVLNSFMEIVETNPDPAAESSSEPTVEPDPKFYPGLADKIESSPVLIETSINEESPKKKRRNRKPARDVVQELGAGEAETDGLTEDQLATYAEILKSV
jgi:hypothetical protein